MAFAKQEPGRRTISTPRAPAAMGPYSQAVQVGNTLYLAGQIGLDPSTGELVEGGIEAETRQALENLAAILDEAGFTFVDVVQVQVFLADLEDYGAMNRVYGTYFAAAPPARAVVEVSKIPRNAQVEITMIAVSGR
ncbi:MAG: Rid family detoxifying hydrolase [Fidelibacterota bacterium]